MGYIAQVPSKSRWRTWYYDESIRLPLMVGLSQIALSFAVVWIFMSLVPTGPFRGGNGLTAWDGQHYITIATHGYPNLTQTAFFPLYPILIRAFYDIGISYDIGSVLIANLAFLFAVVLFYKLTSEWHSAKIAKRAMWLFAAFPAAFFMNMAYTESLTLAFTIGFFYALYKDRWYTALILGFLATATHDLGVILVIPALLYWWKHKRTVTSFLSMAIIPLSLVFYMVYLQMHFHNPTAFIQAQKGWGRIAVIPVLSVFQGWTTFNIHAHTLAQWNMNLMMIINGLATLFMVTCTWFVWRDREMSWGMKLFYILTLLASISSGTSSTHNAESQYILASYARFMLVLFPAYMVLGKRLRNPYVIGSLLAVMFGVKLLLAGIFGDGYWVV